MAIAELVGNRLQEQDAQKLESEKLAALRSISQSDTSRFNATQSELVSRVKKLIEWIDDERPSFASKSTAGDKFADLISLARDYQECATFFTQEVGVNSTTVWRWASGKSRPSRYVAQKVCEDIRNVLINLLFTECEYQKIM